MKTQLKNYKPKINARNKIYAKRVLALADKYSIIGVVDVTSLPALQFQRIRAGIKKTAEVMIVKKNIIELSLNELEKKYPGISELTSKCSGVTGLIFTNDNPFTLFKFISRNKSTAPAKPGQIAPNNIIVPAGPTSFSPGPIIGELGAFKIKAGINAGKVEIKEDSIVAKEGDTISAPLAGILSRLGIEPMEVGLNLKAVYEEGIIYNKETLAVDEEAILSDMRTAASESFRLALGLKYFTKETTPLLLGKGAQEALGLGVGIAWPEAETIKLLVVKAQAQGSGVAMQLPENLRPAGLTVAQATSPVAEGTSSANEAPVSSEEKKEEEPTNAAAGLGSLF